MKKLIAVIALSILTAGCPFYTSSSTSTCYQYDVYGNCVQYAGQYGYSGGYGSAGLPPGAISCSQYDAYGNCTWPVYPSDGSFHTYDYHKNSRGEVYDGNGNRMPQYE